MKLQWPVKRERKALDKIPWTETFGWLLGAAFNRSKRNYDSMLEDPTRSSLIMAVILWIVRRWPEAPIYLIDPQDQPVRDHAMLELIENPNNYYSGNALWFGTMMSLVWNGNGYWIKFRDRYLQPTELWYIPHFMMRPMVRAGSTNFTDYYEFKIGGRRIELDPSDVVHFRNGLDPFNMRYGFSPLRPIVRDAVSDEEADNWFASLLLNMGVPGLIATPDVPAGAVPPDDSSAKEVKRYLEEMFTSDNRGKPFATKGPWKIQEFGFNPQQMDLSTLRGIPEERITAVTGVPAAVVGFGSGLAQTKVGATMKELREMAYEDAIVPLQRVVLPELRTQLLDDFEVDSKPWQVAADLSQVRVLQEDQDKLHARAVKDFDGGLIYLDEARAMIGVEGDESVEHVRRIPFNVTETPAGVQVAQNGLKGIELKSALDARGQRFIKAQNATLRSHQSSYGPQLEQAYERVAERVTESFNKLVESGGINIEQLDSQKAAVPTEEELAAINIDAHKVMVDATSGGGMSNELSWQAQYLSILQSTHDNLKAIFGLATDIPDPVMRDVLAKGGKHIALVGVDAQTQNAVFKGLLEGRSAGDNPRKIAVRIRELAQGEAMYPGVASRAETAALQRGWSAEKAREAGVRAARQYRSEVVARTESKYAQNVSTLHDSRASGLFTGMQAVDAQLGPTDDECEARDGSIYSFEDADIENESEHPNGTLSWVPVITGGA